MWRAIPMLWKLISEKRHDSCRTFRIARELGFRAHRFGDLGQMGAKRRERFLRAVERRQHQTGACEIVRTLTRLAEPPKKFRGRDVRGCRIDGSRRAHHGAAGGDSEAAGWENPLRMGSSFSTT